jgi:hypothetical protein
MKLRCPDKALNGDGLKKGSNGERDLTILDNNE